MLQDKDRIFINLYGDSGRDIKSAKARGDWKDTCLLYTSPSPRDLSTSRMPSSA